MLNFIKQFLLNPKETGAIAASSEELADLITNCVNLTRAKIIVELGSGNGTVTKKILEKKSGEAIFFSLETNRSFVSETRNNCNSIVYQDSAANIKKYLVKQGFQSCDCVISGLPWASFDNKLQGELMRSIIDCLDNGGEFATLANLQGLILPAGKRFRSMLKDNFSQVTKTRIVWKNIPPTFVYWCKK
jgi:phosphatidylethanolamine/phosphatidyl-N-methylethanolamine N-methyltransferase